MSRREYKTVAMPQIVKGRRRRRQSRAEMIAELVSGVINRQARKGWTYVRSDTFQTPERRTWFHRSSDVSYTVLVFERWVEEAQAAAEAAAPAKVVAPAAAPVARSVEPAPLAAAFDPATVGDLVADADAPAKEATPSPAVAAFSAADDAPDYVPPREVPSREPMFAHNDGGSTERRQLNAVAASALVRRRDDEAGGSDFAAMGAKMRDAIAHWVEKARGQAH